MGLVWIMINQSGRLNVMIGIPFTNQQIKTLHQSNYIQSEEKILLIFDKSNSMMLGSILIQRQNVQIVCILYKDSV